MHEQSPGSTEEHEHLLIDLPGDGVRPEVSAVCDHKLTLTRLWLHTDASDRCVPPSDES